MPTGKDNRAVTDDPPAHQHPDSEQLRGTGDSHGQEDVLECEGEGTDLPEFVAAHRSYPAQLEEDGRSLSMRRIEGRQSYAFRRPSRSRKSQRSAIGKR
jgi:hypothetical protein